MTRENESVTYLPVVGQHAFRMRVFVVLMRLLLLIGRDRRSCAAEADSYVPGDGPLLLLVVRLIF